MAKKSPLAILNELARPSNAAKGRSYDPNKPWLSIIKGENGKPTNAKPGGYAAGQMKKDLKVIADKPKKSAAEKEALKHPDIQKLLGAGGRGRPTQASITAKEEEGKKTGRNKLSSYSDKESKQGIRDITLIAHVKCGNKTKTETKKIKDGQTKDIDMFKKEFEKALYKKYDFECDINKIEHKFGEYEASDFADNHQSRDPDAEHTIAAKKK